jgi:hypothetical protein
MLSDRFVAAAEAFDPEAMGEALAPDVRFLSPVVFHAYEGRDLVLMILGAASRVLEDFAYVSKLEDADSAALIFGARVGDRELDGLDLLSFDPDGLVAELKVMVRPLSGAHALADAIGRELSSLGIAVPGT